MDSFVQSSFGSWLAAVTAGVFSTRAHQSFLALACGWALCWGRHTVTSYLWLSGAVAFKHFTRYYVFLGTALYWKRDDLWSRVLARAAAWVPPTQEFIILIDDTTKKKAGQKIEGASYYRNGAGTARQEYRTLHGLNFVLAGLVLRHPHWPTYGLVIPVGLELYLKEGQAKKQKVRYLSRSALARKIVDRLAGTLPDRTFRVLADGGYATKTFLRERPDNVEFVSRMLVTGKLYEPPPKEHARRGRPRQKGELLGSPKTLAKKRTGWSAHPAEPALVLQAWDGIWHSVLPGELIRMVVVRRTKDARAKTKKRSQRKPRPNVEAFFSTDTDRRFTAEAILKLYKLRWAIEIEIRDAYQYTGLGEDQCRKYERIVGINTLRQVLAGLRTLWFLHRVDSGHVCELTRWRPWYRTKTHPSQLDVTWTLREELQAAGVFPIPRFLAAPHENHNTWEPLPLAAG